MILYRTFVDFPFDGCEDFMSVDKKYPNMTMYGKTCEDLDEVGAKTGIPTEDADGDGPYKFWDYISPNEKIDKDEAILAISEMLGVSPDQIGFVELPKNGVYVF